VSLADRKPICAVVLWRQQPDDDVGLIRTSEVRMQGEAADGPFEQYDLSEFCTSELHAVKVGAYYVARRKYITHTLRLTVKPDAFNSTLGTGDLVRVTLRRETNVDDVSLHDYLYEVERISKDITGSIVLDLTHFPVNADGAGLVNIAVANMQPNGITLPSGRNDFSCNVNNDSDVIPSDPGGTGGSGSGGGGDSDVGADAEFPPGPGVPNPSDPVGNVCTDICGGTGPNGTVLPGDEVFACDEGCENVEDDWWVCPTEEFDSAVCYRLEAYPDGKYYADETTEGKFIHLFKRCPDPSSPDGYGEPAPACAPAPTAEPGAADAKEGELGAYTVSYRSSSSDSICNQFAGGFCSGLPLLKGVFCSDGNAITNGLFSRGPQASGIRTHSRSGIYGMRAFATSRTRNFICSGTETATLQSFLTVQVKTTPGGAWVTDSTAPSERAFEGNMYFGSGIAGGFSITTTAIGISITGP
jgi:hypothetical protein